MSSPIIVEYSHVFVPCLEQIEKVFKNDLEHDEHDEQLKKIEKILRGDESKEIEDYRFIFREAGEYGINITTFKFSEDGKFKLEGPSCNISKDLPFEDEDCTKFFKKHKVIITSYNNYINGAMIDDDKMREEIYSNRTEYFLGKKLIGTNEISGKYLKRIKKINPEMMEKMPFIKTLAISKGCKLLIVHKKDLAIL